MWKSLAKRMSLFVAMGLLLAAAGCSKSDSPTPQINEKAFDGAAPALKAEWDKIVTASKSSDYATAILACRRLQIDTNLTAEQRSSVDGIMTDVNDRLTAAAEKGDAAALKAVQDIRTQLK